jgi:tRNA-dihydrouridine synthase A
LGVDDLDKYEDVKNFINIVSQEGGVNKFIVHARKCLLHGLSPHENRTIPPLKYDWVFKLKEDFPDLRFVINGGFTTIKSVKEVLGTDALEGCMVGRLAYNTPWELAKADRELFGATEDSMNREEILEKYAAYCQNEQDTWAARENPENIPNSIFIRPIINLFSGEFEGGLFRKTLNQKALDHAHYKGKISDVILETLEYYKGINPEALVAVNGKRIVRPSSHFHSGKEPESETHSPRGDDFNCEGECS